LARLRAAGQPVPYWVLGGGTALMIQTGHRLSKDIDAFINDPQYLTCLSPRLGGEAVWACDAYSEASNHLKLVYPEGEIDFIVAASITGETPIRVPVDMNDVRPGVSQVVEVEHPVEIALKKLHYRGSLLKVRDVFDIAVVDSRFSDLLDAHLDHVAMLKPKIQERLSRITDEFCRLELAELAIADAWRPIADICLTRVREIVDNIPTRQEETGWRTGGSEHGR
jgi:hypothetical protein